MAVALSVEMILFSSLFLLPISVISQNNRGVKVGSSLTASTGNSSSWPSPSGDFAFGFSPYGNNDRFLLSIWYAKIPDKTVVWYAYADDNPVVAPRGSVLNLTANGLVLNNPRDGERWIFETTPGTVANGVMDDTGNFVLLDENSGSLWETFSNPTDTVLPGQTIEKNVNLSCRQSETNYTKGRFQLRLQDDGNLVLYNASKNYSSTETTAGEVEGSQGKKLVFDSSGDMFVLRENNGKYHLTGTQGVSARDNYIRATLGFDGIFALYSHPKPLTGNVSWSSPRAILLPPPKPIPDDKKKSRKSVTLVESVLLAISIFVIVVLSSALCLRFFFISRKKIVIRSNDIVLDSNLRSFAYEDLQEATNRLRPSTDIVLGSNLRSFEDLQEATNRLRPSTDIVLGSNLRSFTYEVLQEATKQFEEELGRGAFGVVYKGVMQIGSSVEVAVKRLNCVGGPSADVEEQFKTELNVMGQTLHRNLVRLYGYCDEGQQRLLVYEFMSKGTLASFLFSNNKPSWRRRIEIACGVAQGLLYLHEECRTQIVHCDIKPQNILLDDNYTARISDFGFAKLLPMNQSQILSAHQGTTGYVAPERSRNVPITTEVDVYSFGVVLLEIICCRRRTDMEGNCEERAIFTNWVYDCYIEGVLDDLVEHEVEALDDRTKLEKFVMVAIWCFQEVPSLRPTMRKVVEMLEGDVEVPIPKPPLPYISR